MRSAAVVTGYQAGLLNVDTAQKELRKLEDETGMFGSITDEEIAANAGKTYQDATALRDPLMGLGYEEPGGEVQGPFESSAADAMTLDYSPNQPRDRNGRWTGGSTTGKTKYAPSPQRKHEGIQLGPKTYVKLTGTLNTRFPGLKAGEVRIIRDAKREYTVEADGYGGFKTVKVRKFK